MVGLALGVKRGAGQVGTPIELFSASLVMEFPSPQH